MDYQVSSEEEEMPLFRNDRTAEEDLFIAALNKSCENVLANGSNGSPANQIDIQEVVSMFPDSLKEQIKTQQEIINFFVSLSGTTSNTNAVFDINNLLVGMKEQLESFNYVANFTEQLLEYFTHHEVFETLLKPKNLSTSSSSSQSTDKASGEISNVRKCPECSYSTYKKSNLDRHLKTHEIKQQFTLVDEGVSPSLPCDKSAQCSECEQIFRDPWYLKKHSCNNKNQILSCPDCSYKSNKKGNLELHMRSHTREQNYKCTKCEYQCNDLRSWRSHAKHHKNNNNNDIINNNNNSLLNTIHQCPRCEMVFIHEMLLKEHEKLHDENPELLAAQQQLSTFNPTLSPSAKLANGLRTKGLGNSNQEENEDMLYSCAQCDYKCNKRGNLKLHLRIHSPTKKYRCTLCDYTCNFKSCLDAHTRRHTGERPFKCSMCDKAFRQKKHLIVHERNHEKANANL